MEPARADLLAIVDYVSDDNPDIVRHGLSLIVPKEPQSILLPERTDPAPLCGHCVCHDIARRLCLRRATTALRLMHEPASREGARGEVGVII
ncbi:hypothetical protein [Rhizobium mongolense]